MSPGFFESLFRLTLPSDKNLSDGELKELQGLDIDEGLLWAKLLTGDGRRLLAAKMTHVIRCGLSLLSPYKKKLEVIEVVELDRDLYIPKELSKSELGSIGTYHYIDATGLRVVTASLINRLLVPIFTICEVVWINLEDARNKDMSAIRIAFLKTLMNFSAEEKSRYQALLSVCKEKNADDYVFVHTDTTVITCDKPEEWKIGFSFFKVIGMCVVEIPEK